MPRFHVVLHQPHTSSMASLSGNSGSGGDDDGSDGYTVPLIGLAVSVLSFGMFAVPMKLPAVVAADCAPVRPHAP